MENNGNYLRTKLLDNGIKPTYQRIVILDYLENHHIHPTVDDIYRNLAPKLTTLSRTTIYNTVKVFVKAGIVSELNIDNSELRYDITTETHGHFKCDKCGKIYNFNTENTVESSDLKGFKINSTNILINGICKDCLKKENE